MVALPHTRERGRVEMPRSASSIFLQPLHGRGTFFAVHCPLITVHCLFMRCAPRERSALMKGTNAYAASGAGNEFRQLHKAVISGVANGRWQVASISPWLP